MKKFSISFLLIIIFSIFAASTVHSAFAYNYYRVDTLENGSIESCYVPTEKCSLNSAIQAAEDSPINTVIELKIPYKNITGINNDYVADDFPFYFVHEVGANESVWKAFPAPVNSAMDLNNLKEDITDYFFTLNTGILQVPNKDTFFTTIFFGQFRKFYPDVKNRNDYDVKSPIYRIIDIPQSNLVLKSSAELNSFVKDITSGKVDYQKITLNGWSLRIYEQSFSRAVFAIIFLLTILVVLMNLLVFPNILVYLAILFQDKSKSKTIGVVYDKETGEPISFVSLRIFTVGADGQKTFIKQTISDLDGKYYGFPMSRGKYLLQAQRGDYMNFEQNVEIFDNEGSIALDIQLSKISTEFKKDFMAGLKNFVISNIRKLNKYAIFLSFIVAIINIALAQNLFNVFILIIASLQLFIYWRLSRKRYWGLVLDAATNIPIKTAFVKVFNPGDYTQLDVRLTDEQGRFGFILRKPEYLINVKAFGYKYPALKDTNSRITSASGEVFIKLTVPKNKKIDIKIYMEKLGSDVKII